MPGRLLRAAGDGRWGLRTRTTDRGVRAASELIEQARRAVAAAGMDVGGVEYLVSARDGEAYFYDVRVPTDVLKVTSVELT